MGDAGRPVVALLDARLRLYRGDEAAARATVERIRACQDEARASGQTDRLMVPSEHVMWSMIELATRGAEGASEAEWDALEARSARWSVGQEHIEVLEMRAVAAARRGRDEEACRQLEKALAAAERIPNVMGARLRRGIEELRARRREQQG
jgi:eukaryotic-like serine/threonine-protein kinase